MPEQQPPRLKPALVFKSHDGKRDVWVAWNEHGTLITTRSCFEFLEMTLVANGYFQLPPNSAAAGAIRQRLFQKGKEKGWL